MTESKLSGGKVIAVRGAVVDVGFEPAELPRLDEALIVEWDQSETLIIEVQAHLDERTVRGVALQATAGLKRGVPVRASGNPVMVPIGDAVLGRLLDVTDMARDGGVPLPADMQRTPIHRTAPPLGAQPDHRHIRDWYQNHRPPRPASARRQSRHVWRRRRRQD